MSINCGNKHVTPELYSFRVTVDPKASNDEIGIRPPVPAHLRIDSQLNSLIDSVKNTLMERLPRQISDLSKNYLPKLILSGIKRNLTLLEALKPLSLSPDDPTIAFIEPLYDKYTRYLKHISLEEVQARVDPDRISAIKDWNPLFKEQIEAVFPQVNPLHKFMNVVEWENGIKFALSPNQSQLTPGEYTAFTTIHRKAFNDCNLERLERIAEQLGADLDLRDLKSEIEKAVGPKVMRNKINWVKNPVFEKMLAAYKALFEISLAKHQSLDHLKPETKPPFPSMERELIYIEEYALNLIPGRAARKPGLDSYLNLLRRSYDEILQMRMNQVKECLVEDLKDLSEQFCKVELIQARFSIIETVLQEQEKHSFNRFYQLPYYFYSFVHTVFVISDYLRKESIGSDFIETVKDFLMDPQSDIKTPSYRKPQFMGRDRIDPQAESELLAHLNSGLLISSLNEEFSFGVQRSHTLPYPGLFSWESTAFRSMIPADSRFESGEKVDHEVIQIKKDLFLPFKNREISQEQLTGQLLRKLEKKKAKLDNPQQLFHFALLLLKGFYLRLFSETQLMPEVINQKIDKLSEWISANGTYKEALRDGLIALIDQAAHQQTITEEDAITVLNDFYIEPTLTQSEKTSKEQSLDKPKGLFMLINVAQVHKSMLNILRNPEMESRMETVWNETTKRLKSARV